MMTSLLSWLSKSSSVSNSSSSSLSTTDSSSLSLLLLLPSLSSMPSPSSSIPSSGPSSGPSSSTGQDSLPEQHLNYPQILDASHQPCSFHFPRRLFGNKNVVKRGFNASWFDGRTAWLYYDESKDLAFCFLCMKVLKKNTLITSRCADKAFTSTGFSNWKDAKVAFRNHKQTKCHKEAAQTVVALPRDYRDCAGFLSSQHAKEKVIYPHISKNDIRYV